MSRHANPGPRVAAVLPPGARPDPVLEFLAWLMDRAVKVPGTKASVGLDALIGLLPVGGDAITGVIQAGIVLYAITKYKVPKPVATRMVANVLLDLGVGSIPVVGDLFDAVFKANTRNLQLLREVQATQAAGLPVASGPSVRYLLTIGGLLGAAVVILIGAFVALVVWVSRPSRHA